MKVEPWVEGRRRDLDQKKPVILCVDDEPANLRLLERLLGPDGYEVIKAGDGIEALHIVATKEIDLVIMDVMMPGIDGYEACRRIKSDERYRQIPVIMITALDSKGDRIRGIEEGADEFLVKPFDRVEVLARVKMLLRTKQFEEMRRKSEKLAMIGLLAGGVGNELRNPLGVMSNAVFFLKMKLADSEEVIREYLDIITQEIDNAKKILSDFLDAISTRTPRTASLQMRKFMAAYLSKHRLPENIELRTEFPEDLPWFKTDPSHLEQVLRNLITNAGQAMPDGGTLTIRARAVQGFRKSNIEHEPVDGKAGPDYIEIDVSDTGTGITPENMKKLFEPLFTTKSRGIGLGLVVSRLLVEANGGKIAVNSRWGEGTSVIVTLPAAAREA